MPRLLYLTFRSNPDQWVENLILPALMSDQGGPFGGLDICRLSEGLTLNWDGEPQDLRQSGRWSHCLVCGELSQLHAAGQELDLRQLECPTYAWARISTPFIDYRLADTACLYDFFVTYSTMAAAAYKALLQGLKQPDKRLFKAAFETRTIRPAVDCRTFRPASNYGRGPSRAELRQVLFDRPVTDHQVLVSSIQPQDLPTTLTTAKLLADRMSRPVWLYVQHDGPQELVRDLIEGSEIEHLIIRSEPLSTEQRHRLYCASDLYLCTDYARGWPYLMVEAQASGCTVAGPDDHVWLECLDGGRGIELPADLFEPDHSVNEYGTYCRRVLPGLAAERIHQELSTDGFKAVRETSISWAHATAEPQVERCVRDWYRLLGFK